MNKQKGQVFPLTALMLVVLTGVAALANDASTAYSQQQRQQQDLDTVTKLAATGYTYSQAQGFLKARGYDVLDTSKFVLQATASGPYAGRPSCLAASAGVGCYVEGYLTQNVHSFVGKVLGFDWMKVSVHSVAEQGGSYVQLPVMLALNPDPSACGLVVQGGAGTDGQIIGDVHSNSQTCVKSGNVTVIGSVTSDTPTSSSNGLPITGTVNNDSGNGSGTFMSNPYNPGSFSNAGLPPKIVTTLTTRTVCGYTIPAGDTYYQPLDNTGVAVLSVSLNVTLGNYHFLPYCDSSGKKTAGIYVFNTNMQMSCSTLLTCPVVNVYDSTFVFNFATGSRVQMTGGTLNMVGPDSTSNSPFYGSFGSIAMWQENTPNPCTKATTMKISGQISGSIRGIVDLQCTDLTVIGNSSNTPFIDGCLVAWDITLGGSGIASIDPGVAPGLPRGAVLVQ